MHFKVHHVGIDGRMFLVRPSSRAQEHPMRNSRLPMGVDVDFFDCAHS